MKNLIIIIVGIVLLVGCSSNNGPSPRGLTGGEDLDGAKYLGGKIWQEQRVNKSKKTSRTDAEKYCKNLNLLEISGWTLPSIDDVRALQANVSKLDYMNYGSYYHTDSLMCSTPDLSNRKKADGPIGALFTPVEAVLGAALTPVAVVSNVQGSKSCKYAFSSSNKLKTYDNSYSSLVRCVLDPNIYNKKQKEKMKYAKSMRDKGTYDGYMEAFKSSKSMQDIKQAYASANTMNEKLEVERITAEKLPKKVFTVSSGKSGNSSVKADSSSNFIVGLSGSSKDVKNSFQVSSKFLEYGSYRVKVKFILDYTMEMKVKMGFLSSSGLQHGQKVVIQEFSLNRANNFRQNKLVVFKDVVSSVNVSGVGGMIDSQSKTKDAKISFEIIGVTSE